MVKYLYIVNSTNVFLLSCPHEKCCASRGLREMNVIVTEASFQYLLGQDQKEDRPNSRVLYKLKPIFISIYHFILVPEPVHFEQI